MRCDHRGTPLDRPGQAHSCRTDRAVPGRSTFAVASRRVVAFGVAYVVATAVAAALTLAGYAAVRSGAADPAEPSTRQFVLIVELIIGLVALACVIGLLISTVVWIVSAHRVTATGPGLEGYGGLISSVLLVALANVLPTWVPTASGTFVAEVASRIGGVAVLVAGVLLVRARVRRETGQVTLAGRPPLITGDDWDASMWDPQVQREIDRARRGND